MKAGRTARGDDPIPDSDRRAGVPHPREQTLLFGHMRVEAVLLDAYRSGRLPHAWIFGGREGIGKATLAWRFARFLAAHPEPGTQAVAAATSLFVPADDAMSRQIAVGASPNIVALRREWNEEAKPPKHYSVIRVDEVRAASRRFQLSAVGNGWRIAIVDTADDLNINAANALLKLIEEPPPRSLFILVSNQPGRLLPTIRSRCRRLQMEPLGVDDLSATLTALDRAAEPALVGRARGSVAEALRLQEGTGGKFASEVEGLLRRGPVVDWRAVSALADRISPIRAEADWDSFVGLVFRFLDEEVHRRAGEGAARLAPLARVWEKFEAGVRTTEALNLDKRPLILSLFDELGTAAR